MPSSRSVARPAAGLLSVLAFLLGLGMSVSAGEEEASLFIYAVSERGVVTINGFEVDKLKGAGSNQNGDAFDPNSWWDIAVDGPDRYTIRRDGRVAKNGKKIKELNDSDPWIAIAAANGSWAAVRKKGRVSQDGEILVKYQDGGSLFSDVLIRDGEIWALRADGRLFRGLDEEPVFFFNESSGGGDGDGKKQRWFSFTVHPITNEIYALRRDGTVVKGDPDLLGGDGADGGDPSSGTFVVALPNNSDKSLDKYYNSIRFTDDGTWWAIRGDGRLHSSVDPDTVLVDFPGKPTSKKGEDYRDLQTAGSDVYTLRMDGRVYRNTDEQPVINMKKKTWRRLGIGTEFPDTSNVKDSRPQPSKWNIQSTVGDDVAFPILAVDRDTPVENLIYTVDETTLPAGAAYDEKTRSVVWPAAGPAGVYTIVVDVDDGETKSVVAKQKVTLKAPDTDPEKNSKPLVGKISKATGLQGVVYTQPILVSDPDGDALTVTLVVPNKGLPEGASYDAGTGVFTWDAPHVDSLGGNPFTFEVFDGISTTKLKLSVKIQTSLVAF